MGSWNRLHALDCGQGLDSWKLWDRPGERTKIIPMKYALNMLKMALQTKGKFRRGQRGCCQERNRNTGW